MEYLSIRNFEKYQHYKDRKPPWIKLYWSLISDPNFYELSDASKWVLIASMLLASQHDNKIPFKKNWIIHETRCKSKVNWQEVLDSGFIICYQDDSNMLADCKRCSIVETETETETDIASKDASNNASKLLANDRQNKRRSKRVPESFKLSPELRAWTLEFAPGIDMEFQYGKFMDCEFKTPHSDWEATWRNWVRNYVERSVPQKRQFDEVPEKQYEKYKREKK